MIFLPQEIIRKKRDREELSAAEIRQFVLGIAEGSVNQGQIAAFTMATYLNGMSVAERVALTLAMRDSGTVLDWEPVLAPGSKVIEKHSSGGVGDEKVTLLVLPIVAACGVFAPNISGRSLGHTGGELDLLESIPGYTIEPSNELFLQTVRDVGTAIIGPTSGLAPADRAIFHVRDVTATVESIPLIVSSILSKKLAAGPDGMVMTVPFGTGAFMREEADAVRLARALVEVGEAAGLPIVTLISDLEQVLGDAVANQFGDGVVIADQHTTEAQFIAQAIAQQRRIRRHGNARKIGECGHDRNHPGLNRRGERRQVHFAQRAIRNIDRGVFASRRHRRVGAEMLGHGGERIGRGQIRPLDATHLGDSDPRREPVVLAGAFGRAPPTRIARYIEHRREGHGDAVGRPFAG